MKIVVDINQPMVDEYFGSFAQIFKMSPESIDNKALKELNADALVCRSTIKVNEKLLAGTNIKYVGTCTIGYDHVDREYLEACGIGFDSAAGCNAVSVGEYIAAVLVKIALKHGFDLNDKVLGIVGVGNVGGEVLKKARALGMKVMLNDPPRERTEKNADFCSLQELLETSDFVTLHVPLTKEGIDKTVGMANEQFFRMMKKGAVFINACRGRVAHSSAVIDAIDSGKILEAVLDVFEGEPDVSHELVNKAFVATEHISGHSLDGKINGTKMICSSLKKHFGLLGSTVAEDITYKPVEQLTIPKSYTYLKAIEYAIDKCYNIMDDSALLKAAPEKFMELRKNYKNRYEFSHYSVVGCDENILEVLYKLGFIGVGCE